MTPLSLLAAQKLLTRLTTGDALQQQIALVGAGLGVPVPPISGDQIVLSSAAPDLADKNIRLTYPRVCVYSGSVKNTQIEKFRAFSGQVGLVAEIWSSADLITQVDQWIHFYVESVAEILQNSIGDWGDGVFYPGSYEVLFNPPKAGGFGFVESAKLMLGLNVSTS